MVLPKAEPWITAGLSGVLAGSSEAAGDLALLGVPWMGGGLIAGGMYIYVNYS